MGGGGLVGNGLETLKNDFTVLKMETCSIHLVQMERGRMFNSSIYKPLLSSHQYVNCILFYKLNSHFLFTPCFVLPLLHLNLRPILDGGPCIFPFSSVLTVLQRYLCCSEV